jgi:hypothetical protein
MFHGGLILAAANAAGRCQCRNANVTSVIVRRVQSIVRKPVTLFGRLVAPQPAVVDFFDFFAWNRMTVLVAAAFSSYQLWTSITAAEFRLGVFSSYNVFSLTFSPSAAFSVAAILEGTRRRAVVTSGNTCCDCAVFVDSTATIPRELLRTGVSAQTKSASEMGRAPRAAGRRRTALVCGDAVNRA